MIFEYNHSKGIMLFSLSIKVVPVGHGEVTEIICLIFIRSSCVLADSLMNLHTTSTGFKAWWVCYTFYQA